MSEAPDVPNEPEGEYLVCNWCDFRDRLGERGSVWRLVAHCQEKHPVEYAAELERNRARPTP